jgi:hypothetical protein
LAQTIEVLYLELPQRLAPTPAKDPPLSGVVCVPHCTAVLSLSTRVRAFFLFYVEGGGPHLFNAQIGHYYIRSGAGILDLTAHAGT